MLLLVASPSVMAGCSGDDGEDVGAGETETGETETGETETGETETGETETGETETGETETADPAASYSFESRYDAAESSVSNSGQIFRQVLIQHITDFVGSVPTLASEGNLPPNLADELMTWVRFGASEDVALDRSAELGALAPSIVSEGTAQQTFDDISKGNNLLKKLAGNDTKTDHKDWSAAFVGFSDASLLGDADISSPVLFLDALFTTLQAQAEAYDPADTEALSPIVTPEGLDLKQLIQKFLLMAVTYSQGTDDYLDDDVDGKGLLASHQRSDDKLYTSLEHAWDEGLGYFGASRDNDDYTAAELAGKSTETDARGKSFDTDGDTKIDLASEYNYAASINAAKRDYGSAAYAAATDFKGQAFAGLLEGRAIIAAAAEADALSGDDLTQLQAARDKVVAAWENAIVATVIHYINDVLGDLDKVDTAEFSLPDLAKHYSECKGFSLGLQFNPRKQLSDAQFASFHALIADHPVFEGTDETAAYRDDLLEARDLLESVYGFDTEVVTNW